MKEIIMQIIAIFMVNRNILSCEEDLSADELFGLNAMYTRPWRSNIKENVRPELYH